MEATVHSLTGVPVHVEASSQSQYVPSLQQPVPDQVFVPVYVLLRPHVAPPRVGVQSKGWQEQVVPERGQPYSAQQRPGAAMVATLHATAGKKSSMPL